MKYKGEEIGIPTIEKINECISQWNLRVSAQEVHDYWTKKNWLNKKGQPVKTLESACNVANSIFVQRERKLFSNSKSDAVSIKDLLINNIPSFIEAMELIRKENPEAWAKIYCVAARLVKEHDSSHGYKPQ